ncbi:MAG: hypothetical protein IJC09_01885 [Clostridia bacterium]|nr:hypothetical protein [Clostridia bacterium]
MNLYSRLNEIEKKYQLNRELKLRVICVDGDVIEGYFDGYTDALNNEPEITQLELRCNFDYSGIVCIFETKITSIEVVE